MQITKEEKKAVNFEQQLTFSVRQMSEITSLSIAFLRSEITAGALAHIRRRGRILITKQALVNYLNKEQLATV